MFVSCFEEFGDLCQELFGISLAGEAAFITTDASTWLPRAIIEGKRFWFVQVGRITSRSLCGIVGGRLNLCRFSRSFVIGRNELVTRAVRADWEKRMIRLSRVRAGDRGLIIVRIGVGDEGIMVQREGVVG